MGGNALKHLKGCTFERKLREEYKRFEAEVIEILSSEFVEVKVPYYYDNKQDFGDTDLVVVLKEDTQFEPEKITILLDSKGWIKNGNVYSFEYKNFQIDIIITTKEMLETTCTFLSWGLFGKLLGIVCSAYNLKFGNQGLFKKVYEGDDVFLSKSKENNNTYIGTIVLSTDVKKIFEFLSLDYDLFKTFKTESDMYNFVISARIFETWIFHHTEINRNDKTIKHRLDTFDAFVEKFKVLDVPSVDAINSKIAIINKEAFNFFNKQEELDAMIDSFNQVTGYKKLIKTKYNGKIVGEVTGLKNKELGDFMKMLETLEEFKDFCFKSDPDEIKSYIKEKHGVYMLGAVI